LFVVARNNLKYKLSDNYNLIDGQGTRKNNGNTRRNCRVGTYVKHPLARRWYNWHTLNTTVAAWCQRSTYLGHGVPRRLVGCCLLLSIGSRSVYFYLFLFAIGSHQNDLSYRVCSSRPSHTCHDNTIGTLFRYPWTPHRPWSFAIIPTKSSWTCMRVRAFVYRNYRGRDNYLKFENNIIRLFDGKSKFPIRYYYALVLY